MKPWIVISVIAWGTLFLLWVATTPLQCHKMEATVDSTAAQTVVHPCNYSSTELCVTVTTR